MFRTHSPYSPFFTSGLLSEPSVDVPRRGSLPTSRSLPDVAAAFYGTLQPRRDEQEFRSFLSLDLAESQSMRSASLKRKASSSTKSPSHSSRHPFRFPYVSAFLIPTTQCSFCFCRPISEAPAPPSPAPTPLRMRFSRDSLRTIPSPKPAPSITLPDLPTKLPHSSTAPRLPSIPVIPALDFTLPPTISSSPPRAVPQLKLNLTKGISAWSDNSSKFNRVSVITTSTVSTRARRNNRSNALARLEGRYPGSTPQPFPSSTLSPTPSKNFMSMSDDEDSDGDVDEGNHDDDSDDDSDYDDPSDLESFDFNLFTLNPIMEPEDCVLPLPLPSSSYLEAPRSAPLPPTKPYSRTNSFTRSGPAPTGNHGEGSKRQRTTTTRKAHSRKAPTPASRKGGPSTTSTTSEWFPLKSFIDLHNEREDSSTRASSSAKGSSTKTGSSSGKSNGRWSTWRSFIEVAHVS
jgi:hypothetical protein